MPEHILETRIQLRYATYSQWMNSRIILKAGEAAVATFPSQRVLEGATNSTPENTPPAIGIKIGDGVSYFYQLPWVQGIAADVYNWAKQISKPSYTASEIEGLDTYIEQHSSGGGSGGGSSVSRQYQIIRGTGDNINKYYLQYKNDDGDTWIIDTNHYIDVEAYQKLVSWIGNDVDNYPNLRTRTGMQMLAILEELGFTDTPQTNYFVTAVNQSNGIISVNRARPSFSNLVGYATVEQGGTGLTSFPVNEVLVGNGNALITVPIAEEIDNNTSLVPNYLIKAYVDAKTEGLTGAMHYIGEATVEITGSVDPRIGDYDFTKAQPGDVITSNLKEYVWTGYNWRLLGDEGSYAVKGSIKDADIDTEAAIQPTKIAGLMDLLAQKVTIVEGKDLSSNDYTDEDKMKLLGIENGAQQNLIEHFFLNNTEIYPTTVNNLEKSIHLQLNLFTDLEKLKLESVEENAQENTIESISVNGTQQLIDSAKNVNLIISEFTQAAKNKLDTIEPYAQPNAIQTIYLNNVQIVPNADKRIDLHIIELTEAQVTKLDALDANAQENIIESIALNGEVQAVSEEKQVNLFINEFTEAAENKLNSIEAGAQVNVIETIYINNTQLIPSNKRVDINFLTITQDQLDKLNSVEVNAQENVIESISLNDIPQTILNKNVNLSINEFTEAYESKLNGIEAGAQVNTIETIYINNRRYRPNNDKEINITIDQAALDLDVITGAIVPDAYNNPEEVTITQAKKLSLARIAKTGNVMDLKQNINTYIILDCGTSTTVL